MNGVPLDITRNLLLPIFRIGFRQPTPTLARVSVPKTSVNEDDLLTRAEHNVRLARQVLPVQAVPIAHTMQEAPHHHLGFGVATFDRAHGPAAQFRRHRYVRRIAVGLDSLCTSSSRTMRVVRTMSASRWATSKLT